MEKKWLENKTFMRIISFIAAIALWVYVVSTQDPPRTSRVNDIAIKSGLNQYQLNDGLIIVSKSADSVSFKATGNRSRVTGMEGSYSAGVNLDDITQPGYYSKEVNITKPDGVYVDDIEPFTIDVYVDKNVSHTVPINILTSGTMPDGYIIKKMSSTIQEATIMLPSLMVEQISYIGATVDLGQINGSDTINCTPVIYDKNNKPIDTTGIIADVKNVAVEITVDKTKTVNIMPVISGIDNSLVQYSPKTIEIHGDASVIDEIEAIYTQAFHFDTEPLENMEYTTKLILPPGVDIKDGADDFIKIKRK